jgi:protein phosphatase
VRCRFALASDVGRIRANNEDSVSALPDLGLFAVADGMGGHVAGEFASRLALETLVEVVRKREKPRRVRDIGPLLCEAILAANSAVYREAETRGLMGMGTTLTALYVRGRTGVVGHVGDSRAALVRGESLRWLTRDQTLAGLLMEAGSLDPGEMGHHPERHLLLQAIGPSPAVQPELVQTRVPREARLLLSSDGLHDVVSDQEIAELASIPEIVEAVHRLVERANALGGPDNITVLLVEP